MAIIKLSENMPYSYYKEKLQEIHDKLKDHPFRVEFKNEFQQGTFKSLFNEYKNLIYDATEVIAYMCYRCADAPIKKKDDDFWIHDFRNGLITLGYYFNDRFHDNYYDELVDGLEITKRDVLAKTGATDINVVMLWLEKFITDIHIFLQTDIFDRIIGIEYEPTAKPHNGWYYKHFVEYERKEDGSWTWVHEPEWINGKRPEFVSIKINEKDFK